MFEFAVTALASLLAGDWLVLLLGRLGIVRIKKRAARKTVAVPAAVAKRVLKRLLTLRHELRDDAAERRKLDQEIASLAKTTNDG